MAIPTGSEGQSWKTSASAPSVAAAAISRSLPVEYLIIYEAPIGLYAACLADFIGTERNFTGATSSSLVRTSTPDVQILSWSLSTTTAPGVFDGIIFIPRTNLVFGFGIGNFHYAFGDGSPDPDQLLGSRKGLLITSLSAQPSESVAESPHLSLEPLNFSSDLKVGGDIYIVPTGISVAPGIRIIDFGGPGQQYTGSFLKGRVTESTDQLIARFTSSDAPVDIALGLKGMVAHELVTLISDSFGPLVRNDTWGGGLYMPSVNQVAIFGDSKTFAVPFGNFTTRDNLNIESGSLNVTSGSIYIQGNFAKLEIIGLSASAFFTKGHYPQPWGRLTESKTSVVDVNAQTPGVFDGTFLLVPSASTPRLLELHARISGTWFPLMTQSLDLIDGGTF